LRVIARSGALWYIARVPADSPSPHPADSSSRAPRSREDFLHSEGFLRELMSRQLRLSVLCALAFLSMLVGLPLANYFLPELMARRVGGGFTLTWFILGIGFFPAVWLIAWYFIRNSMRLEREEVQTVAAKSGAGTAENGRRASR
jgi:uncharacterized membrane protein (DUF485 family)